MKNTCVACEALAQKRGSAGASRLALAFGQRATHPCAACTTYVEKCAELVSGHPWPKTDVAFETLAQNVVLLAFPGLAPGCAGGGTSVCRGGAT